MNKTSLLFIVVIAIAAAVISPLLFIWALNTLFGLTIAYGFFEWLAALLLLGALRPGKLAEFQVRK
jgi:hypothetical protein